MRFEVLFTEDAAHDLEEIYTYIYEHDGVSRADQVAERPERLIGNLAKSPGRGSYSKELLSLGIRAYRQVFFKPYRVIYRVVNKRVYIYIVIDGRRDMQMLLARRLSGV